MPRKSKRKLIRLINLVKRPANYGYEAYYEDGATIRRWIGDSHVFILTPRNQFMQELDEWPERYQRSKISPDLRA